MKNLISILILIIITSFSLTSCNYYKDNTQSQNSETTSIKNEELSRIDTSKLLSNSYVQLLTSDRYLLKFKAIVDFDPYDIFSEVTFAKEGGNSLFIIEADGSKSHIITKGNTAFMIDQSSKSYIKGTVSNIQTSLINSQSLVYSSQGKEIINGIEMIYEEYKYDIGTLKFFFNKKDKEKLYGILNTNPIETVMMQIIEFSPDITHDMFEIPNEYKMI